MCVIHSKALMDSAEFVMRKLAATVSLVSNWCPVFALNASRSMFLCAYLCVTELPSLDYTREIDTFEPASSPSEAATFELIDGSGVKSYRSDSDRRVFFEKNPPAALHTLPVRHHS